jgi:hypothetical protein
VAAATDKRDRGKGKDEEKGNENHQRKMEEGGREMVPGIRVTNDMTRGRGSKEISGTVTFFTGADDREEKGDDTDEEVEEEEDEEEDEEDEAEEESRDSKMEATSV